jgi:hypothetical protein
MGHRVLAEFQSRKAHRVLVRDADLLKYLSVIVFVVAVFLASWTALSVEHLQTGNSMLVKGETERLNYTICKLRAWDDIIVAGERRGSTTLAYDIHGVSLSSRSSLPLRRALLVLLHPNCALRLL